MRRDFCNEDTCYQRLVGWGGTIRTSALENQPAKTSVESSSWSFTGLFERSFTGPFDHSFTGALGSVIHRKRVELPHLPAGPSSPRTCFVRRMRRDFFEGTVLGEGELCSRLNESKSLLRLVQWVQKTATIDIEPVKFRTRREAQDWCIRHYPGSPSETGAD